MTVSLDPRMMDLLTVVLVMAAIVATSLFAVHGVVRFDRHLTMMTAHVVSTMHLVLLSHSSKGRYVQKYVLDSAVPACHGRHR